ncbi:MAG TPA: GAF domain-containing protein, partial [Vicinamibacterales bacterium]|nr:GAF domain-containing protein [Vicinamibacterales bacterium]
MANTVDGVETAVEPFDAFEDLLAALARGPDIRDIFRHLSAVFSRIVPHEEAHLAVLTGDDDRILLYTATRDGAAEVRAVERKVAIADADQPRLLDVVPGTERGLQSGLSVPVRIDGRLVGVFALFSRRQQIYSDDDLVHAETLAGYLAVALAHERLAQHAREAAVERERTASIEASMELLQTIADVLDIRTVFSRVSEIANKMLPHDRLVMAFIDREGNLIRQAASTDDVP